MDTVPPPPTPTTTQTGPDENMPPVEVVNYDEFVETTGMGKDRRKKGFRPPRQSKPRKSKASLGREGVEEEEEEYVPDQASLGPTKPKPKGRQRKLTQDRSAVHLAASTSETQLAAEEEDTTASATTTPKPKSKSKKSSKKSGPKTDTTSLLPWKDRSFNRKLSVEE